MSGLKQLKITFLAISMAAFVANAATTTNDDADWNEFKLRYGKRYGSAEEEKFR